jgi:hypothetical protein
MPLPPTAWLVCSPKVPQKARVSTDLAEALQPGDAALVHPISKASVQHCDLGAKRAGNIEGRGASTLFRLAQMPGFALVLGTQEMAAHPRLISLGSTPARGDDGRATDGTLQAEFSRPAVNH